PPYHGSTALEAIMLAQLCDVRPPDELPQVPPNTFPRELVRIVMKALAKRPDDRYPSVAALKLDIMKLMRGGGNFATIRVARGAHVIRQGEVGDAAYIVVSGKLEVYKTIDGERVSLRMLGPGDMFGETAIFAASPRTASVVVLEDASLVLVTSDVIEQELASMKPWMGAFIRTLASRFGGLEEERRARTHSGPAVSAALPIVPGAAGSGAGESVGPMHSPLNSTYQSPPNSRLSGPSNSPLNARPGAAPAAPSVAVREDRSDVTVVADLMADGRDDDASLAAPGESVMIDLADDDDASQVGATISTVTEAAGEAEDADTRLIGPWTKKPPPRSGSPG
ncbi:MAG: cyclic nucleotide-binding domain-containing protein, partial [Myxococcales bacterium]|nr:cyclic nucleotide-binding domain-containing protein [Myxococcales bacterium]